jgi:hypothetical protein
MFKFCYFASQKLGPLIFSWDMDITVLYMEYKSSVLIIHISCMDTCTVAEIIDLVFAKTSPKRLFSMTEYERFGLVFTKTRVYKFRHRTLLPNIDLETRVFLWNVLSHLLFYFSGFTISRQGHRDAF